MHERDSFLFLGVPADERFGESSSLRKSQGIHELKKTLQNLSC